MFITVRITAPTTAELIAAYDQIQVHRSKFGKEGPYEEITLARVNPVRAGMRPLLELGRQVYEYVDEDGDPEYWYKARYYNSVSTAVSSFSEPFMGDGDSALDILSVEDLKTVFLYGVDLTKDDGAPYPNELFEFYIKSAVSWLEQRLQLQLRPKDFTEKHDFLPGEYGSDIFMKLNRKPIMELHEVKLVLPGGGEQIFDINDIHVEQESGQLNIYPGTSTTLPGLAYRPSLSSRKFLAQAFHVKYRAGFKVADFPANIRELVGKVAAFGPLNIAGDLVAGAGLAGTSLSIDGLSQSVTTTNSSTNAGYGARLILYRKEVKDQIEAIRSYYAGIGLTVA